jgi:hypothetical protein
VPMMRPDFNGRQPIEPSTECPKFFPCISRARKQSLDTLQRQPEIVPGQP